MRSCDHQLARPEGAVGVPNLVSCLVHGACCGPKECTLFGCLFNHVCHLESIFDCPSLCCNTRLRVFTRQSDPDSAQFILPGRLELRWSLRA